MEQIKITRKKRYTDKLRAYKVFVDDKYVGKVLNGQEFTMPVDSGNHTLQLFIDWTNSDKIEFSIQENENVHFECYSAQKLYSPINVIFSLLKIKPWIYLSRV